MSNEMCSGDRKYPEATEEEEKDSHSQIDPLKYIRQDFQEAEDDIIASHNEAKMLLETIATERLERMQQKLDMASRAFSAHPDDQEVSQLVLNSMFQTIDETCNEMNDVTTNLMSCNLDTALQNISSLSRQIRRSIEVEMELIEPSTYEINENIEFYILYVIMWFVMLILLFLITSDFF